MGRQWTLLLVLCVMPIARVDALENQHYCFDDEPPSVTTSNDTDCDDLREIRYIPTTGSNPIGFGFVHETDCDSFGNNGENNLIDEDGNRIFPDYFYGCVYVDNKRTFFAVHPGGPGVENVTIYADDTVYVMVQKSNNWITKFYCSVDGYNTEVSKDIAFERCRDHQKVLHTPVHENIKDVVGYKPSEHSSFCGDFDTIEYYRTHEIPGDGVFSPNCVYVEKSDGHSVYAVRTNSPNQTSLIIGPDDDVYSVFNKESNWDYAMSKDSFEFCFDGNSRIIQNFADRTMCRDSFTITVDGDYTTECTDGNALSDDQCSRIVNTVTDGYSKRNVNNEIPETNCGVFFSDHEHLPIGFQQSETGTSVSTTEYDTIKRFCKKKEIYKKVWYCDDSSTDSSTLSEHNKITYCDAQSDFLFWEVAYVAASYSGPDSCPAGYTELTQTDCSKLGSSAKELELSDGQWLRQLNEVDVCVWVVDNAEGSNYYVFYDDSSNEYQTLNANDAVYFLCHKKPSVRDHESVDTFRESTTTVSAFKYTLAANETVESLPPCSRTKGYTDLLSFTASECNDLGSSRTDSFIYHSSSGICYTQDNQIVKVHCTTRTTTTTSTKSVRRAPVRPSSLKKTKNVYPFTTQVGIIAATAAGVALVVGVAFYVRTR